MNRKVQNKKNIYFSVRHIPDDARRTKTKQKTTSFRHKPLHSVIRYMCRSDKIIRETIIFSQLGTWQLIYIS